ncbi:tetratricopeptide repeat protein [bacterium]|nr:tetratricopeptide repeat protein [bacterium]
MRSRLILTLGCLVAATAVAATPDELPLPADQVIYLPENPGADIGLPLGATKAYAIGRSLQNRGESEASLVYLNRAYRLAPDSPRIARAYAQSLVETGYVQDATRIVGRLVEGDPDDLELRYQHAQLLAQSGRPRMALDQVREVRERGRSDPGIIKFEADLLGQLGRVDDAVEVYRDASRRDPDRTEDFVLAAGLLLQKHGRIDEMASLLQEGLERDPASRPMRLALIRYLAHEGDIERARELATAGDELRRRLGYSQRPECGLELAELLARRGNYPLAIDVLEGAREAGFRDRETDAQLARFMLTLERTDAARRFLDEAVEAWPEDAEIHFLLGRALEMSGDIDRALTSLEASVSLEPSMPLYRISLLRLLVIHRADDLSAAEPTDRQLELQIATREHARRASVSIHPQDSSGHMILGSAFRALGDLDRACGHFERASEVAENRVPARLELGFCLEAAGEVERARATLRQLHDEYPDHPEVSNSYGYFLAERNEQLDLAERLIQQALQVDPKNGAYLDSLGWVYYRQGRYEEAFDYLIRATNQRGDDPVILEHLGRTLARMGRLDEAIDVLRRAIRAGGDPETLRPLIADLRADG